MALVRCTACGYELAPSAYLDSPSRPCPSCRRMVTAVVLPAIYKVPGATPPPLSEPPPAPGESVCFYNPSRRATKVCDHCGVFVSDAWAAKWGAETVCLKCLEKLRTKEKDTRFEAKRNLWDNIALACAIGPFVLAGALLMTLVGYPFAILSLLLTFITAPTAIFIALRFWKAPRSLVPRGRLRLYLALILSILQVGGWVTVGVALYQQIFDRAA